MAEHHKEVYRQYLACCNAHDFESLGEFVHEDVAINGQPQSLSAYQEGLSQVVAAFPDYRWELGHLLAESDWLAAHFTDTGTHGGRFLGIDPTGKTVETQEFAFYRPSGGKIAEVWVTADNLGLRQLGAFPS